MSIGDVIADEEDRAVEPEIVHWYPPARRFGLTSGSHAALGAAALAATAAGALAVGALAVGAMAVGALAVGRLSVRRARIGELRVDRLIVGEVWEERPGD